ncbi:MAG: hypothetical protein LRY73_03840 [Bacillus sp. (in: Bacteria)]|nr:hypothetical protein [Bacillus sp. (in: firmicutes)]
MQSWKKGKEIALNEKGYTLVLVLLVIVVLSITGISIMGVTATNVKTSSVERDYQAVYYIAEAGATIKMEEIKKAILDTYADTSVQTADDFFSSLKSKFKDMEKVAVTDFKETFGEPPSAEFEITKIGSNGDTRTYEFASTGNIGSRSRTVIQTFDVNWEEKKFIEEDGVLSPYALFATESLTLGGNSTINGHVGTGASSITGEGRVSEGYRIDTSVTDTLKLPNFPTGMRENDRDLSGNQEIKVGGLNDFDEKYNSITINNSQKLTVKVGSQSRALRVNNFTMNSSGANVSRLEIDGTETGFLTIYVDGDLTLNGGVIEPILPNNLKVAFIVAGNATIDGNRNHDNIRAFIFAPESSITITGNTPIFGSLIAKRINMGGSTSAHIPLHVSQVGPVFPDIGKIGEGPATLEELLTDVSTAREQ